ncbi:MAG TPA: NAD(P)H-binding protein, partial [Ktedonobacterales bacterium]|nr:NAD(P)H-binding protein [Ktedonobacterales bacterium]
MILATGATGSIGREVVRLLLDGDEPVAAITRHPATAALPDGAVVMEGDPSHTETLSSVLRDMHDINTVFISPRALGDATAGTAAAELLKLAAAQGARRVVALSAVPVEFGGGYRRFADAFRAVEEAVKASGLPWTILRCAEFDSNALAWAPQIRASGVVRGAYGDAATSPIHNRDVAAVSAPALVDPRHAGQTYALTGPQSLTQRDRVSLIGAAIDEAVSWVETPPR